MNGLLYLCIYMLLFFAALAAMLWWDRRRQRAKKPFPENLRLLRMPGEHLWRRVIATDESDMPVMFLVMLAPVLVGAGTVHLIPLFFPTSPITGLVLTIMVFAFSMLLCVRWCQLRWQRRANDYLGFIGERYVAECLDPLKARGWFLFHDVPCDGATGPFNLDHVAVGPGGIWIVETKTFRKRPARTGFKPNEVAYDGKRVQWPWGDEAGSLNQALNNSQWLREWLDKMTGKKYQVSAVLAFPGYKVIERALGAVRLTSAEKLPDVLVGRGRILLQETDIDLIRRQLEHRCRNVEY